MTNSFFTLSSLARRLYVPFNMSETRLEPNTAQPVAFITILLGQKLRLAWLQLHFISVNGDPSNPPNKVNLALAASYAGLYGSRANYIIEPAGQPLVYVPCEVPGVNLVDPNFAEDISAPDTYGIMVINNFQDAAVDVSVTGAFCVVVPS